MQNSKLSDHTFKNGVFRTKLMEVLGGKIQEQVWFKERLPEYLWIALVFDRFGRMDGLRAMYYVLTGIQKLVPELKTLRMSDLIRLPIDKKKHVFSLIIENVGTELLSPLTLIVDRSKCETFFDMFYVRSSDFNHRLWKLIEIINRYSDGSSNETTDIKFVLVYHQHMIGHLNFLDDIGKDFFEYPKLNHDHESMRQIRPFIRSTELMVLVDQISEYSKEYNEDFWRRMYKMTECKILPNLIIEDAVDVGNFVSSCRDKLEILTELLLNTKPLDDKRIVSLGLATFAYKRLIEIVDFKLENTISGRSSVRCIIECLFNLKFLKLKEKENKDIWKAYQAHGIGKYKLISERYIMITDDKPKTHVDYTYIDNLVGEYKDKEFIDMDTSVFEGLSTRKLAELIDELELYGQIYDYDSSYEHALWGAIRESSQLKCTNPAHMYHYVPDIDNVQKLPSVLNDVIKIMGRILEELEDCFEE